MKKNVVILLALFLLSSCTNSFYQVYTVQNEGLVEEENKLVYENEDCRVNYNLWGEHGNLGFTIYNKTEIDMFVVLSQSFFIKNGIANDYYKNREYKESNTLRLSSGWTYGTIQGYGYIGNTNNITSGVTYHERPIICIPPHSLKMLSDYSIVSRPIRNCDKHQEFPRKVSIPIQFTKEDSPVNFINRISYSFDKDGTNLHYVDNQFWISEITNYSKKMAGKEMVIKDCESDSELPSNKKFVFNISSPNKFYNFYRGKSSFKKSKDKGQLSIPKVDDDLYK
jgi:hypothetical protein